MARTILNYCDNCGRICDFVYLDDYTGLELCVDCFELLPDEDEDEFEFYADD
jgi:hypothetical protein